MNKYLLLFLIFCTHLQAQDKFEVYFDFNKSDINPEAKLKLDSLLSKQKNIQITKIYGYADKVDNSKYNDSLSLKRAKKVQEYFKLNKVEIAENIEIKGFGEKFNQNQNQNKNRKVIIHYSANLPQKIIQSKVGDKIILKNINFLNFSDVLLPESKSAVKELIAVMKEHPNLVIAIQGHICCQTQEGKYDVSEARAKRIYDILVQNGINKKRLSYHGFGGKHPIYKIPEKTESERIANRRVEIEIIQN